MRKLVLILLVSFAVVTFIRAYDNAGGISQVHMDYVPELMK